MIHSQKANILSVNSSEKINLENNNQGESADKNETKQEYKIELNEIEEVGSKKTAGVNEDINYDDEVENLLKTKKTKLQNKFEGLVNKFNNLGDINIYKLVEKYSKERINLSQQDDESEDIQNDKNEIKKQKRIFLNQRGCKIYICSFFFLLF